MKFDDRLGACDPVKPFNPEALAFPSGGKSKPMPVIVEVDPGVVIAEVFVIVKVNVLVWELNSQTTVAVENWPESTPTTEIVWKRFNWDIGPPYWLGYLGSLLIGWASGVVKAASCQNAWQFSVKKPFVYIDIQAQPIAGLKTSASRNNFSLFS